VKENDIIIIRIMDTEPIQAKEISTTLQENYLWKIDLVSPNCLNLIWISELFVIKTNNENVRSIDLY